MASAAEILVLIRGKDEASKVLNGVGKSVGGLGSALGDVAKIAGGFVLGAGLLKAPGAIKGLIDSASDLNETLSKSNTVFKENGSRVEEWAKGAAKSFGQSKKEALDAASGFGNMFSQLGIGTQKAASMSMAMTELGSDFASFHNDDITDVLTAQSAAFRGEYDALQRYVPTINAAAVEQKALSMGLAETTVNANDVAAANVKLKDAQLKYNDAVKEHGKSSIEAQKAAVGVTSAQESVAKATKGTTGELTAQDKALATYQLMIEGAGDALGDFDRTAEGAANKQRILQARLEDTKTTIGQQLLPVYVEFLGFILDKAIPAGEALADKWGPKLAAGLDVAVSFLRDNRATIEGTFNAATLGATTTGDAVAKMGGWIIDNESRIVGAVVAIGLAFAIFNPGAAVLIGIGAAVTAIGLFKTSIEDLNTPLLNMRLKLTDLALSMTETANTAATLGFNHLGLKGPLEGTIDSLNSERDAILKELDVRDRQNQQLAAEAESRRLASEAGVPYLEYLKGQIQAYRDALPAGEGMDEQLRRLIQRYTDAGGAASDLDGVIGDLGATVQTAGAKMDTALEPAGTNVVQGFMNGIIRKASEIPALIKQKIADPINASMEQYFEMHSPSQVMHRDGENLMSGLANGISSGNDKFISPAMDALAKSIAAQFGTVGSSAWNAVLGQGYLDGSAGSPRGRTRPGYKSGPGGTTPGYGPEYVESHAWDAARWNSPYNANRNSSGGSSSSGAVSGIIKPAIINPGIIKPKILGYAKGTPYVPSDGLAYLHRGEAVIPASQNGAPSIVVNVMGAIHSDRDLVRIIREAWLNGGFRGMPSTS